MPKTKLIHHIKNITIKGNRNAGDAPRDRGGKSAVARCGELGSALEHAARAEKHDLLASLGSSTDGITSAEATRRLEQNGPNSPSERRRLPLALRLAASFVSPFTLILAALAAVSLSTPTSSSPRRVTRTPLPASSSQ